MKFGHTLEVEKARLPANLQEGLIRYRSLKTVISNSVTRRLQLQQIHAANQSLDDTGETTEDAGKAHGMEGEGELLHAMKKSFLAHCKKELVRVNKLFVKEQEALVERAREAQKKFARLPCHATGECAELEGVEYEAQTVELVSICERVSWLKEQVRLNREGFRKIAKKFTRRCGSDVTSFFFVTVGSSALCSAATLDDVLVAATKLISELRKVTDAGVNSELPHITLPPRPVFLKMRTAAERAPLSAAAASGDVATLTQLLAELVELRAEENTEPDASEGCSGAVDITGLEMDQEDQSIHEALLCCKNGLSTALLVGHLTKKGASSLALVLLQCGTHLTTPLHRAARVGGTHAVAAIVEAVRDIRVKRLVTAHSRGGSGCKKADAAPGRQRLSVGKCEETSLVAALLLSRDSEKRTPLHCATTGTSAGAMVRLVHAAEACGGEGTLFKLLEARDEIGNSALLLTMELARRRMGLPLPAVGDEFSPELLAIYRFQRECVTILLGAGAVIDQGDFTGSTFIHKVAENGCDATMAYLFEFVGERRGRKAWKHLVLTHNQLTGATPLHVAHSRCIEPLLDTGRDSLMVARDLKGKTALHYSVSYLRIDALEALARARTLLQRKADPNLQDLEGCTALHELCLVATHDNLPHCIDMVKMLVGHGAATGVVNSHGFSCYDDAMCRGQLLLAKALHEESARLDVRLSVPALIHTRSTAELELVRSQLQQQLAAVQAELNVRAAGDTARPQSASPRL